MEPITTLKDFNIALEQIFQVAQATAANDPDGRVIVNAYVGITNLAKRYESGSAVEAAASRFMGVYSAFAKDMVGKMGAKLDENSQLKSGEAIKPAAVATLWGKLDEMKAFFAQIREIEEAHNEATKKAKLQNVPICSLCTIVGKQCQGTDQYRDLKGRDAA